MSSSWLWEDTDSYSVDNDSICSSAFLQAPIVVGYAFGPKKMSTMGVVMAEASRAEVIHEDEEELFYGDYDHPGQQLLLQQTHTQQAERTTISTLTSAALEQQQQPQHSTIISLGNSEDTNLKHIVRYFRSSCSSAAASMSETTVSTPTTPTAFTRKKHRFPVRISFVPLDPDIPLEEQHGGNFDLILHKLTEDILSMNEKEASLNRIRRLQEYHKAQNCCLVDDPLHVSTLMSRSDIAHVLQTLDVTSASGIPVKAPKFVVVNDEVEPSLRDLQSKLDQAQLTVPLIIKPLIAAGTKQSHYMTIALQESAISKIPPKSLIQEYVNHNATLYKVYVLGESVHVYERTSLPNLPERFSTSREFVEFDSQRPYPRLQDFGIQEQQHHDSSSETTTTTRTTSSGGCPRRVVVVSREEVRPIVKALKQAFGLELFGFDILVKQKNHREEWLVVDVNYFPSYKEVPDFPSMLAQYLCRRVLEKRRTTTPSTTVV